MATSVTFDEVYALDPARGFLFYLVGLTFAVAVSETILRGIRLRLPTKPPFDGEGVVRFLARHEVPGLEHLSRGTYTRAL